jgi:hypothetical protein
VPLVPAVPDVPAVPAVPDVPESPLSPVRAKVTIQSSPFTNGLAVDESIVVTVILKNPVSSIRELIVQRIKTLVSKILLIFI